MCCFPFLEQLELADVTDADFISSFIETLTITAEEEHSAVWFVSSALAIAVTLYPERRVQTHLLSHDVVFCEFFLFRCCHTDNLPLATLDRQASEAPVPHSLVLPLVLPLFVHHLEMAAHLLR